MSGAVKYHLHGAASFAPMVAPRHRLDQAAIAFAREKRAQRCSWAGIAAMLGCSEPDIRAAVDTPIAAHVAESPASRGPTPADAEGGLASKLRFAFGLSWEAGRLLGALLTPAGMTMQPAHHETAEWRRDAELIRKALAKHGLADALDAPTSDKATRGYLVTRDGARRIRVAMAKAMTTRATPPEGAST